MKKLRSAIIGCGKMAHVHAQALMNIEETVLVAAQSRSLEKATDFATKYQAQPYTDIAEMIRREQGRYSAHLYPPPRPQGRCCNCF